MDEVKITPIPPLTLTPEDLERMEKHPGAVPVVEMTLEELKRIYGN